MANVLFDPGREGILDTTIPMTGDIRVMLMLSMYTFVASHKFLSDLGSVDNGRSTTLQNKTYTNGIFDADNISLVALAALPCNALVIFYHTGSDATARVIGYIDNPAIGFPFTPAAGQTVNVVWDTGTNKVFKL